VVPIWHFGNTGSGAIWVADPSTSAGEGMPNPTAHKMTVSSGRAGVDKPGYKLVGPSSLPFVCVATTYPWGLKRSKEGTMDCLSTVNGTLDTGPFVTTTVTEPNLSSNGLRTLIWSVVQTALVAALQ
jgi:hypothetical protein